MSSTSVEKPWLSAAAVASAAALMLTACGDDDADAGEEVAADTQVETEIEIEAEAETLTEGTLQVCSDVPYPPFEYYVEQGEVVGFDIDIASSIAQALDLDLEVIESSFDGIQSGVALNSEHCDMAISGMTITEEREGNMLFSEPYLDDNLGLLAPEDSGISSTEDLDGVQVGVQQATTGATYAQENGYDVIEFEDSGLMHQGLETGQVDALIGNISIIGYHAGDSDEYEFAEEIDTGEELGIAVQQDNQQLIEAVDEVLAELETSGQLDEMEEAWFHSETPEESAEGEEGEDDTADDDTEGEG